MRYSCVIATYHRADRLRRALASLEGQTHKPERVIVVDGDPAHSARPVCSEFDGSFAVDYQTSAIASAAKQRNQGAEAVETPFVVFMDDDVEMEPELFEKLLASLHAQPDLAGIAPRMNGFEHKKPRGLLWWYYRLQAGFSHPHYGGLMFGAAVNCLPCYAEETGELTEGNWLSSTIVMYRTDAFREHGFPAFDGYSWMEDACLSASIAQTRRVAWHNTARYDHFPSISPAKRDRLALARMRMKNQKHIARHVLKNRGLPLFVKFFLLRLFVTAHLVRNRPDQWIREVAGTWTA